MEYDNFMKGCGFWMQREPNSRTITVKDWAFLMQEMVYGGRLAIWRNLKPMEMPNAGAIYTHSTPKLRKMMRVNPQ